MEIVPPGGVPPTIGRYTVIERVARGVMGDVYSAVDHEIGRDVAIKLMQVPLESQTGQVTHPNLVTVFDRGEDDGQPFIVMELLKGTLLAEFLQTIDAQSLESRLDLMLQICDGLQAAHDRGVALRDLKPSHVFVQRGGLVKLLDVGLVSPKGPSEYASPEQVAGAAADHRSDIFSAAGVFYFMLTGRAPVVPVPVALAVGEIPEALGRVLRKALDPDPDERHQSVAHLRAEIEQERRAKDGDRHRVARAAFTRYRLIEELIEQRRALGKRLGLAEVERECDQKVAELALSFPEFARADRESGLIVLMDAPRAASALAQLQAWHNRALTDVSVLQATHGGRR